MEQRRAISSEITHICTVIWQIVFPKDGLHSISHLVCSFHILRLISLPSIGRAHVFPIWTEKIFVIALTNVSYLMNDSTCLQRQGHQNTVHVHIVLLRYSLFDSGIMLWEAIQPHGPDKVFWLISAAKVLLPHSHHKYWMSEWVSLQMAPSPAKAASASCPPPAVGLWSIDKILPPTPDHIKYLWTKQTIFVVLSY